jgi:hypothetical protein
VITYALAPSFTVSLLLALARFAAQLLALICRRPMGRDSRNLNRGFISEDHRPAPWTFLRPMTLVSQLKYFNAAGRRRVGKDLPKVLKFLMGITLAFCRKRPLKAVCCKINWRGDYNLGEAIASKW